MLQSSKMIILVREVRREVYSEVLRDLSMWGATVALLGNAIALP